MGTFYALCLSAAVRIPDHYLLGDDYFYKNPFLFNVLSTRLIQDYLEWMLRIFAYGSILLGLMQGLGYNIKSPFNKPFYSKDIVDLYSRLLNHYKDYYMVMFYMPGAIILRRLSVYLRSFIAVVLAFFFGRMIFMLLTFGFDGCAGPWNDIEGIGTITQGFKDSFLWSPNSENFFVVFLGLDKIIPHTIGWGALHAKILIEMVISMVFGILFGSQLVFNQWIKKKNRKSSLLARICTGPIGGIVQFALMLFYIFIFF